MFRAYKYRLYPNANQVRELETTLETHRRIYNECLSLRSMTWDCYKETFTTTDCYNWFKTQRDRVGNPFFQRVGASSANQTIRRLDRSFQNFFKRRKRGEKAGYPRFKGRDQFDSFSFQYQWKKGKGCPAGASVEGNKLRVEHVGRIRIRLHRPWEGKLKEIRVKREADRWFVVLGCDLGEVKVEPSTNPPVGLDVGIEHFLTTSEGEHIENPRYLKEALPELRRKSRSLSRKKKGGKNRRKARKKVARCHAKIRNQRSDHHHKLALEVVRCHGLVAVEKLNIQGMIQNRRLSRAIHDAGWGGFVTILKHKAESAGVQVVEVDPRGTSQQCSQCGKVVPKDLSERWHKCPHCKKELHRDWNSAINILHRGRELAGAQPAGDNVDPRVLGPKVMRPPRSLPASRK